jgi:hypothetical protein
VVPSGQFMGVPFGAHIEGTVTMDPCTSMNCDDNNACTTDTCDTATGCVYTPIVCNDNNACTTDTCDTATGCVFTLVVIDDNDACTIDACDTATGAITHTAMDCNDNDGCTMDSCVAGVCEHTARDCNDNDVCTTDSCVSGNCVNLPVVCDDNNTCTDDSCDALIGCLYTPLPDGSTCTVGTVPGICLAGVCNVITDTCPEGSRKSALIKGGKDGKNDRQVMTLFTVVNGGCIVKNATAKISVTPGTILQFDCKQGQGPDPTAGTWKGEPLSVDTSHLIVCPSATGEVGHLILNNFDAEGGKDADDIVVNVRNN